jgi:hypothetical protein
MNAGGNPKNIDKIYDRYDNNGLAFVNYAGWLSQAVEPDKPSAPVLATPTNNASNLLTNIEFTWFTSDKADSYVLQVAPVNDFTQVHINEESLTDTTFTATTQLNYGQTYFWRVRGENENGLGPWSSVNTFTTIELGQIQNTFTAQITLQNASNASLTLTFGANAAATDGFDTDFDQFAPPRPPTGIFDARLVNGSDEYYKDFRPITQTLTTWRIRFASGGSMPVRISWDPQELPEGGLFSLRDAINGSFVNVDMRNQSFIDVSLDYITDLVMTHTLSQQVVVTYTDKWNLVGLPAMIAHDDYQDIYPDALQNSLFGFTNSYVSSQTMEPGRGYWVRIQNPGSKSFTGLPIEKLTLDLGSGWNLVSGLSNALATSAIKDDGSVIIDGSIFAFNGSYAPATTLEPGKGYWIRTRAAGQIQLQSGMVSKTSKDSPATLLSSFDRVEFFSTTSEHPISVLYLNGSIKEPYSSLNFELPPVPPSGNMDVRWENGSYVMETNSAVAQIQQGAIPLLVHIPNINPDLAPSQQKVRIVEFAGDQLVADRQIDRGEKVGLSSQTTRIQISLSDQSDLPEEFTLDQNYPNPFNPTTTIRFGLPESADVRLEVYTVLGQRVMTLVNENRNAGWHTVSFNGANLSSGVYVYRIQAGGMVQTKKLMLVK